MTSSPYASKGHDVTAGQSGFGGYCMKLA